MTMPTEVILPRVDMDMATGRISRWYVEEAGRVEKGQPLFEIETDKAAMEIESPASGILQRTAGEQGQELAVGSTVAWIFASDETMTDPAEMPASPERAAPSPPVEARTAASLAAEPWPTAPPDDAGARATPLARRLARERGIALPSIAGTGPRGRIQSADVLVATEQRAEAGEPARPAVRSGATARSGARPSRADPTLNGAWLRDGQGPPIVLIHGFGSEFNVWRPLLAGLSFERPVFAIDLPGHGRSPAPQAFSFEAMVDAVEERLVAEGMDGLHLVGHSLGAAVAIALAGRARLDARSVLAIAPAGLGPDFNGAFLAGFCRARTEASLHPWMRMLVREETALLGIMTRAVRRLRAETDMAAVQERIAAALFPDGTQAFSVRALLNGLAVPTKIIFGVEDEVIPVRHARHLPGEIAVHLFAGVGHMPQFEIRDVVARLLAELLRSAG